MNAAGRRAQAALRSLPGDDLVPGAQLVIDRVLALSAPAEDAWPWLVQLGKGRAGWYLPRWLELVLPRRHRAARRLVAVHQGLSVGDEVPDWGPGEPVFRVAHVDPPHALVYLSLRQRGANWRWPADGIVGPNVLAASWALVLFAEGSRSCVLHIRLRVNRVGRRAPALAHAAARGVDWLTIVALHAGLRERLR